MTIELSGQDLRHMGLEDRRFDNGRIIGCVGEGASFRRSRFTDMQILAARAERVSFKGASFDGCRLTNCVIGPGTLNLEGTTWREASLRSVRFDFAQLIDADFTNATLTDVTFKSGNLRGVSFRGAKLSKVSFENAALHHADFTGAVFFKMDRWGEPDWSDAIIADELRYQFGELDEPMRRVDEALKSPTTEPDVRDALTRLKTAHGALLSAPACMLIGREMEDIIPPELFPRLLKTLKGHH
jgi:hypothetical protein